MAFDKRLLAKDILEVISRLTGDREFVGHDGRKYRFVSLDGEDMPSGYFDVVAEGAGGYTSVGRYAVVLVGIGAKLN